MSAGGPLVVAGARASFIVPGGRFLVSALRLRVRPGSLRRWLSACLGAGVLAFAGCGAVQPDPQAAPKLTSDEGRVFQIATFVTAADAGYFRFETPFPRLEPSHPGLLRASSTGDAMRIDPELEALAAFARVYGYIRFFHPSDEAAAVDWDRLAVVGARRFASLGSIAELRAALEETFLPVAPTVRFLEDGQGMPSDPPYEDDAGTQVTAWQHEGVGVSSAPFYQSRRLNRPDRHGAAGMPAMLMQAVPVTDVAGAEFLVRVRYRTEFHGIGGGAVPVATVARKGGLQNFVHFPLDDPVRSEEWTTHEFRGHLDADAEILNVGFWAQGLGDVWFARPELKVRREGGDWAPLPAFSNAFASGTGALADGWTFQAMTHAIAVGEDEVEGEPAVHVYDSGPDRLFDAVPAPGEAYEARVALGLRVRVPLTLPAARLDDHGPHGAPHPTPPTAEPPLRPGGERLEDPAVRVAGVVIAWNVLRHFYPYDDVVDVEWDRLLVEGLETAADGASPFEYLRGLERLLAGLDDAHARVAHPLLTAHTPLPLRLAFVEGQVVVDAAADTTRFRPGDILIRIDGRRAVDALRAEEQYQSGSPQFRRLRALGRLGEGERGTAATLELSREGRLRTETLAREPAALAIDRGDPIAEVEPGIFYVDLRRTGMGTIAGRMAELAAADGLILDVRGMPAEGTAAVFAHLTDRPLGWVDICIPRTIRPRAPGGAGCTSPPEGSGFPPPQSPRIAGQAVVLTDAHAYSTAESLLKRVEHVGAAVIVGRPTGGANGNQNWLRLPGGEQIFWTGMRVTRADGGQHHVVGIRPDVLVERTVEAIRQGRDEDVEAAVRVIREASAAARGR